LQASVSVAASRKKAPGVDGEGVTDGVLVGVGEGVADSEGVGVTDVVGVTLGVTLGVAVTLGVTVGVGDGDGQVIAEPYAAKLPGDPS